MAFINLGKVPSKTLERRPGCIQAALCILGDKWTPLLLGQLFDEPKTFGKLESALTGISPRTLSARLDMLIVQGVIEKRIYHKHPPRYHYQLTDKGSELAEILQAMSRWGDKHHQITA